MKHSLPNSMRGVWAKMARDYPLTAAAHELAMAKREDGDALYEARTELVNQILLTPAECAADIRLKIEMMHAEQIADGWWCAEEAFAILALDVRRILPVLREGEEA